jgi:hypothetical protein
MTSRVDIVLSPKTGAFTALRAFVDGAIVTNTTGDGGSWTGTLSTDAKIEAKIEAVGVAGSRFDCKVKLGQFSHEANHTLGDNGRFSETLP